MWSWTWRSLSAPRAGGSRLAWLLAANEFRGLATLGREAPELARVLRSGWGPITEIAHSVGGVLVAAAHNPVGVLRLLGVS
jgi:hypothetical protein